MSMKMAPEALPHPGKVLERRILSPEIGFWMAAELGRVFGKIFRGSSVLGQGSIYGRRGDVRRWPGLPGNHEARVGPGSCLGVAGGLGPPPCAALWTLSSLRVKKISMDFQDFWQNFP